MFVWVSWMLLIVAGIYALFVIAGTIAARRSERFRRWMADMIAGYRHVPH